MAETIWLQRPSEDIPWGFRLHGGRDFQAPLTVQKVTGGSIASTGLNPGDVITCIGDAETGALTHAQAMQVIKSCGNMLQLRVSKPGGESSFTQGVTSPVVSQTPPQFKPQLSNDSYQSYGSPMQTDYSYPFANEQPQYPSYSNGGGQYIGGGLDASGDYGTDGPAAYYDSTLDHQQQPMSPGRSEAQPPPPVPDAVINMAAKSGSDKKPFAYVADVNDIREQRDRVRKRTPVCSLPRYQNMLNMPQFEETTPAARVCRSVPSTPPVGGPESGGGSDAALVANLQFNSPLGLYSGDNVVEALKGQTGGQVTGVVGLPKKKKVPTATLR